jgi:phosphoenolpyruvate carboxykinase (GTP)
MTTPTDIYDWLEYAIKLLKPKTVYYCNGTLEERQSLLEQMVDDNMLIKLNEKLRPNSYLARSDPSDVARLESCTYVCTSNKEDAGPNNNWADPAVMKNKLYNLMDGCMKNKTLYIVPFVMGRLYDEDSIYGVQITDSPYVVVNMSIMATMGTLVWNHIINTKVILIKCLHTVACEHDGSISTTGTPLSLKWPSNKTKYISHFPETLEVISYGSGYGGNALLGKKCIALRLASYMGLKGEWWAEHMSLFGVEKIGGERIYVTGCNPSGTGKTNFSLIKPALPGWKITTLGDDIVWLRIKNGTLYGMNPEAGMFGVATNTSYITNPNCMETISNNTIFTNVALTKEGDVWWDGLTDIVPEGLTNWKGNEHTEESPAAHPNSRFTVSIKNCPLYDDNLNWVPVSAIIFGGKRNNVVPLVREALSWDHGIYMGATICSEQTAAAEGPVGELRYDPFAMLPFCGYHMGKYFQHWLSLKDKNIILPKIFYVNWFRRDANGKFLWPGFSQNIRVLDWIYDRVNKDVQSCEQTCEHAHSCQHAHGCEQLTDNSKLTPIGHIPTYLNTDNINVNLQTLLELDKTAWKQQMQADHDYLIKYMPELPEELLFENTRIKNELDATD